MTAYAAVAAALAAFLAVQAANRQERAAFTSALYSKQVDVLALLEPKYVSFELAVNAYFTQRDPSDHPTDEKLYNEVNSARIDLDIILTELQSIYPEEATSMFDEISSISEKRRIELGDEPLGPRSDKRKVTEDKFGQLIGQLVRCSVKQLRTGANLDGKSLSNCYASLTGIK